MCEDDYVPYGSCMDYASLEELAMYHNWQRRRQDALNESLRRSANERTELIISMLDKITPIPENAPEDVRETIDQERQLLAVRAGWTVMPLEELRKLANQ
jgi:hypothetical protein